jgi:hypothetical protein
MKNHELAFKAVMVGTFFVLFFMLLAEADVLANYAVDRERFGIGE